MILALIFDLDGTLVQTEALKARSYARAAVELCPHHLAEEDVINAYKTVVGQSRQAVATYLVERFKLAEKAVARQAAFGVSTPWQAFVQVRLGYYSELIDDPAVIRDHRCRPALALLPRVRARGLRIALATTSSYRRARIVLAALGLTDAFDFIATSDDVERNKPDPEIYRLVAAHLSVDPAACLVLEDSLTGVRAALAAGMQVVAVPTDYTRHQLLAAAVSPPAVIADPVDAVGRVVNEILSNSSIQA